MSNQTSLPHSAFTHAREDASMPRLCLYRGRACRQFRDRKPNGDLHRLCRTHRERHNQYQRDSQQRRRRRVLSRLNVTAAIALAQVELPVDIDHFVSTDESVADAMLLGWLQALLDTPQAAFAPVEYLVFNVDGDEDTQGELYDPWNR